MMPSTCTYLDRQTDPLDLERDSKHVALGSRHLVLTRKEFELLSVLLDHVGVVVPRRVLLQKIWGYGPEIRTRTLDVHIHRLRQKIESHRERYIATVVGIGYRFQPFQTPNSRPALHLAPQVLDMESIGPRGRISSK
jgi:DNA-binding response OmpR family regulator